jgi:heavy metal translocating P-type ATPase
LADTISAIFVPGVLLLSISVFLIWFWLGNPSLAISAFVGILVIACPCALGLATPTAIIVGVGKGAENGILIKDASVLEKLHKIDTIVFDKTGTITIGKPQVSAIVPSANFDETEVISLLASLEKHSSHPLAEAIMQHFSSLRGAERRGNPETIIPNPSVIASFGIPNRGNPGNVALETSSSRAESRDLTPQINLHPVTHFKEIPGKGVTGTIKDKTYFAGNATLLKEYKIKTDAKSIEEFTNKGMTPVFLFSDKIILGIVFISDSLKKESKDAIATLHKLGIKTVMLTGDDERAANFIAKEAGIDRIFAQVLPTDKAKIIEQLTKEGACVAMVGDGINDAPALATAEVGIAMSTGTDIAIESAGITLLHGDLSKVAKAIKLSKATMNTIKQNLFWAFFYNVLSIPVAAGLLYPIFGIVLNPAIAGAAMAFSSVSVVTNSLRLKTTKL